MGVYRKILSPLTFSVLYAGCFSVFPSARKGAGRDFQNSLKNWSAKIAFNCSESKTPKPTGGLEILAIEYNSREQSQRLHVVLWGLNDCQTFLCFKHSGAAMTGATQNCKQTDNKLWLNMNYYFFFPQINDTGFAGFEGCLWFCSWGNGSDKQHSKQ